jgi:DNA-binding HxlR family transcriptional regulator
MSSYGQFCPVAKAAEVLAERWTPLVLRELLAGSHRFNDLQRGVPLMSRSLLSKRLRELETAGVVERRRVPGRKTAEYFLTPAGDELRPLIEGLGVWGQRWLLFDLDERDLDPSLLMWDVRRNLAAARLPDHRVVARFDFARIAGPRRRWWLVVGAGEPDLCMTDPGFEVDVFIAAELRGLTRFWQGLVSWDQLVAAGDVELTGPPWLRRSLPGWFERSPFAEVPRPAAGPPGATASRSGTPAPGR